MWVQRRGPWTGVSKGTHQLLQVVWQLFLANHPGVHVPFVVVFVQNNIVLLKPATRHTTQRTHGAQRLDTQSYRNPLGAPQDGCQWPAYEHAKCGRGRTYWGRSRVSRNSLEKVLLMHRHTHRYMHTMHRDTCTHVQTRIGVSGPGA